MKIQELRETPITNKRHIANWLDNHNIENYRINDDLSVDVHGTVDLVDQNLRRILVQFNEVSGSFDIDKNNLISLQHAPRKVGGFFSCNNNKLTSLEGAPQEVGDNFYSRENKLTSLHRINRQIHEIGGYLRLSNNPIKSHTLGLMRIRRLQGVDVFGDQNQQRKEVFDIINNNLQGTGNIHTAQEQLLAAGLGEFAQI